MELKFKNITKCSKDMYNQFLKFHDKTYSGRDSFKTILIILIIVYMIIFNITYKNWLLVIILLAMAIAYFISNKRYQNKVVSKQLKSSKIKNQEEIVYYFYKWYLKIETSSNIQNVRYYRIYRIHDDNANFYLYTDRTHAFVVSKNGFIKGNANDFKNFISKKCLFKYRE